MRSELRRKGVSNDIIEQALEDLDEEAGAMKVAEKKVRRLTGLDKSTFRRRMWGFLKRRGFSYNTCHKVTDHFWQVVTEQEGKQG